MTMPRHTTSALPPDANGDIRYPAEAAWPIKASCIRCYGKKTMLVGYDSGPGFCFGRRKPCTYCNERGYYFLPLGG